MENDKYKYVDKTVKKSCSRKCIAGNDDKRDSLNLVFAINLNMTIEYLSGLFQEKPTWRWLRRFHSGRWLQLSNQLFISEFPKQLLR